MILQALHTYYRRLLQNPDIEISMPGFAAQGVHFALVLDKDGKLVSCQDIRIPRKKGKPVPRSMILPYQKRSGQGFSPNFFWDNTGYALGADSKEDPDRARKAFEEFKEFHKQLCSGIEDPSVKSVLRFLEDWSPDQGPGLENWEEMVGLNVVFRLDGEREYVHEHPCVKECWLSYKSAENLPEGNCLITGRRTKIARLHPDIKGVDGAQTKGASLVSFNLDAFCSYGKDQNYNAPIGNDAAFAYTAALNYLLRRENNPQRIRYGETTTVFWAERPSPFEGIFGLVFNPNENLGQNDSLRLYLEAVRMGRKPAEIDPDVLFYILGLSPNISRLSVRFWYESTVGAISEKLGRYFNDIQINKNFENEPDYPPLNRMLLETAIRKKWDNIPPLLEGAMTRSVLAGLPFPNSLLPILLDRIRSEQAMKNDKGRPELNVNYLRASLIKGVLVRNHQMEVSMALDLNNKSTAYLLGRLFSVLERAQAEAINSPNATIRDRYYSSASATPGAVFPILLRLAQHHVAKAEYGKWRDKEIEGILGDVSEFPKRLSLEEQGLFAIGYYHQRQHRGKTNKEEV
jgi:CRISPR-associated protein Csd1